MSGDVTISVPGAGDRVFAAIDESEMIFAMPYETDRIIDGLKNAGRGANVNVSYPPPPFLLFTPSKKLQRNCGKVQDFRAVITP